MKLRKIFEDKNYDVKVSLSTSIRTLAYQGESRELVTIMHGSPLVLEIADDVYMIDRRPWYEIKEMLGSKLGWLNCMIFDRLIETVHLFLVKNWGID